MIINSILQTDLYKLTMQNFVLEHYPNVKVEYVFNNRDKSMKFTKEAYKELMAEINSLQYVQLQEDEETWIKDNLYFLNPAYIQFLKNYRYDPTKVICNLKDDGQLDLKLKNATWADLILFEVPLMAIISEVYFKYVDKDWNCLAFECEQRELANKKAKKLSDAGCIFADFGTRRRRNAKTQHIVVEEMRKYKGFVGTSNPKLAQMLGVKALGTLAHESLMGVSVLEGLRHSNRFMMQKWQETYKADLGTMLTDTFGTDAFLQDFNLMFAKTWDGVRHDSGCPFIFTDKIVEHYKKLRIDPMSKTIIFSDGLDVDLAIKINEYCKGKIKCSFGIGTHFTNDYQKADGTKSKAMNMVIKLSSVEGIPVVKLSDTPSKAIGDPDAVKVAKWTFFGQALDA